MTLLDLHHGDCLEVLATLPDACVDAVVTDPPYGLSAAKNSGKSSCGGFMGQAWDYDVPSKEIWEQCLRVLKPGGHLLAFAGTRTQHRMAVRIEDAGFEIRDMIAWIYGSGMPKSHNLKGEWEGFGTGLKPSFEPVTMARKPFSQTVAANVLEHGTGAINIDGCRVPGSYETRNRQNDGGNSMFGMGAGGGAFVPAEGRWPANLIHDGSDEVTELFPEAKGAVSNGRKGVQRACYGELGAMPQAPGRGDTGSAARFFYSAKASTAERQGVTHPTVKPLDLMAYLCRLITPPNGTILDPFMGSGTTIKAAMSEGFKAIGIERDPDYFAMAQQRLNETQLGFQLL